MSAKPKSTGCPVSDAYMALEQHKKDFLAYLEKTEKKATKEHDSVKKKVQKLKANKAKASLKKKEAQAKHKAKPSALTRKALDKASGDVAKATVALHVFDDEIEKAKHKTSGLKELIKHTKAEYKMIDKYRKEQEKLAAKKKTTQLKTKKKQAKTAK